MKTFIVYFYFDFLSPYSYLAFLLLTERHLPNWRKHAQIKLVFKPASLPHIIARSGNAPPASVPARRRYLLQDLKRGFEYYSLGAFKMPPTFPFDTRRLLMAAIEANNNSEEDGEAFIRKWWKEIFEEGRIEFLREFPVADEADSRQQLMKNTAEALEKGAFGVPFWVIKRQDDGKEEAFFGSDRFNYMAEFMGLSFSKM